jgi:hypothetical protein
MKLIGRIVGVLFLAMVLVTPGPAQADTANGWYYATPSWDRQLQCDTQATCPRFLVLSDWIDASHPSGGAAVMDRESGLVWEQSPSTSTFPWSRSSGIAAPPAAIHCNELNVGNRKGWRLPTIQELASLVDGDPANASTPRLPPGHPFGNVQSNVYWSATTAASLSNSAWVVDFTNGVVTEDGGKNGAIWVWCVRGGPGGDPQ